MRLIKGNVGMLSAGRKVCHTSPDLIRTINKAVRANFCFRFSRMLLFFRLEIACDAAARDTSWKFCCEIRLKWRDENGN